VFPPVSLQAPNTAKVPGCVFASLQHRLEESPGAAAAGAVNKTLLSTEAPPFHVPKQEQQLLWKNLTQKVIFLFSSNVLTTSSNSIFRAFNRDQRHEMNHVWAVSEFIVNIHVCFFIYILYIQADIEHAEEWNGSITVTFPGPTVTGSFICVAPYEYRVM